MEPLYHYCSIATFQKIIETKTIQLSSLSLSNDSMEGLIVRDILLDLFSHEPHPYISENVNTAINSLNIYVDGLGFCLSRKGDLLSQWRGYADDGQGFSIGFSEEYFKKLGDEWNGEESMASMHSVIYDPEEQKQLLLPIYNELKLIIGETKPPKALISLDAQNISEMYNQINEFITAINVKMTKALSKMFFLKSRAFIEEDEVRLISYLVKNGDDACSFRATPNRLIPCRFITLRNLGIPPVIEVLLGPKNQTPKYVVDKILKINGFTDVKVRSSAASYR